MVLDLVCSPLGQNDRLIIWDRQSKPTAQCLPRFQDSVLLIHQLPGYFLCTIVVEAKALLSRCAPEGPPVL